MLDATTFHPARSGRDHLRVYCRVTGEPPRRADEVLALVGLTAERDDLERIFLSLTGEEAPAELAERTIEH